MPQSKMPPSCNAHLYEKNTPKSGRKITWGLIVGLFLIIGIRNSPVDLHIPELFGWFLFVAFAYTISFRFLRRKRYGSPFAISMQLAVVSLLVCSVGYFALKRGKQSKSLELTEAARAAFDLGEDFPFRYSLSYFDEGLTEINSIAGHLTSEELRRGSDKLSQAYFEGEKASTQLLDKIHPELAPIFQLVYLGGLKDFVEGVKEKDEVKQNEGLRSLKVFCAWLSRNDAAIRDHVNKPRPDTFRITKQ